jgi:hypothetical protein
LVLLAASLTDAGESVTCPVTIEVYESLASPFSGWTKQLAPEPHRLAGVTIFEHEERELALLEDLLGPLVDDDRAHGLCEPDHQQVLGAGRPSLAALAF